MVALEALVQWLLHPSHLALGMIVSAGLTLLAMMLGEVAPYGR
jgi:hypothetical protein